MRYYPTRAPTHATTNGISFSGGQQLGPSTLTDLTPDLLAQWRDALAETRAPASVRAYLSVLSHVLTITVKEWGWLRDNPMNNVRCPAFPEDESGTSRKMSGNGCSTLVRAVATLGCTPLSCWHSRQVRGKWSCSAYDGLMWTCSAR